MRGAGLKSFIMKAIVSISQADVKQEPDPTVDDGDDDDESDSEKSGSAIIREPLDADGEYHQIGSQELFPPPPATPPPPPAPTASASPSPSSSGKSGPKKRAASPSEDNAPAPKAPHLNLGFKAYEVFISFHSFSFFHSNIPRRHGKLFRCRSKLATTRPSTLERSKRLKIISV